MQATVSEVIGVFAAIVILGGVVYALKPGSQTPAVVGAVGGTFYKSLAVATQQKVPK